MLQQNDVFYKNILNQIKKGNIPEGQLYIARDNILKRYVLEGTILMKLQLYQEP